MHCRTDSIDQHVVTINLAATNLELFVCRWREIMLQQPVGLRIDESSYHPASGKHMKGGDWTLVSALHSLSHSRLPVAQLHMGIDETPYMSGPAGHPDGLATDLASAMSHLSRVRAHQSQMRETRIADERTSQGLGSFLRTCACAAYPAQKTTSLRSTKFD